MKFDRTIAIAMLAGITLMSLAGCQEKETLSRGRSVSFQVVSSTPGTKAAYSGDIDSGFEKIDWKKNDRIMIWCEQASCGQPGSGPGASPTIPDADIHYADYTISADGTPDGDDVYKSNAEITPGTNELLWGSNVKHDFYAVYPSPNAGMAVSEMDINTITATVSATQNGDGRFGDGMVMVAKSSISTPQVKDSAKEKVFLEFSPITTAIKFSLKNGLSSAIKVKKVELQSGSHALSGKFNYDIYGGAATDYSGSVTDEEKSVAIENSSPYVNLPASGSDPAYVFTFFLRPDDNLDDLSIVITDSNDVVYTSALKTSSGAYTFESGTKTYITGILLDKVLTLQSFANIGGITFRTDETVTEQILF